MSEPPSPQAAADEVLREQLTEMGHSHPADAVGASSIQVRQELPTDVDAVRAVVTAAFDRADEADLVDALRLDPSWIPALSVVSLQDGAVVGHALATRCTIDGVPALALAPVAVLPTAQRLGHGSAMIRYLLAAASGERAMVVLGHPEYYAALGFEQADGFGITAPFMADPEVPAAALRVRALDGGTPPAGTVGYPAPFGI